MQTISQNQKAPESNNIVKTSNLESLAQTKDTPAPKTSVPPLVIPQKGAQGPITASQLADDALNAPFNINSYIESHDLDKSEFPTGQVKTETLSDSPTASK